MGTTPVGPTATAVSAIPTAVDRSPTAVVVPGAIRDAIVEHALAERPNEACGLVVGDRPLAEGGRALRFIPTRNALASPYRYEVDPSELLRIVLELDAGDAAIWAIVHSHVGTEARPSPSDVALAAYPEALHLIVSLARRAEGPAVRAWWIRDGAAAEVALEVAG